MSNTRRARTVRRLSSSALLALCIGLAIERAGAQQQGSAGANVNVISGTGADGDWTLQRQNEPTIACSSRNPLNCLAGANDYRTVDIPFPTSGEKVTGDAWLGWYTTKDGGLKWRTRLLPGFPQDVSPAGLVSPLRGYSAGADPVVRPGTNGLFYYGGLVFNREEGGGNAIFVARFIDNNNQEGSAGEPIGYLGASIVHRIGAPPLVAKRQDGNTRPATKVAARSEREAKNAGTRVRAGVEQVGTGELVDKPWIAVDIPRAGAQVCTIGGPGTGVPLQRFPGGRVYVAYALFDGPDETRGRIMFSRSTDCANTWSPPRFLSRVRSADVNDDGVATAADAARALLSLGRRCGQTRFNPNADIDNDCRVDLADLAFVTRGIGQPVPVQPRLSQGATLAIDPRTGALQVAWRQFQDGVLGDAIVTVRSNDGGASFSRPTIVANVNSFDQGTTDTSFRTNAFPTMAFDAAGRVYLAWSTRGYAPLRPDPVSGDARIVLSTSTDGTTWSTPVPVDNDDHPGHQIMPGLAFAQGKLQLIYYDLREDVSQLFGPYVDELPILAGPPPRVRHTIDVRAAQADPGPAPAFASFRLSQYRIGGPSGSQTLQQLEFNPPNLPLFRAGSSPFMGDYLDVASDTPFVRNGSSWAFNTAATASPVFHGIWTDNRDIRPPANGDWTAYTPPNPPFARPSVSAFDPTQPIPPCVPGQAGMRNQNIYTARITQGLIAGALGNTRRLGPLQRSFPVFAQNNSTAVRSYRLTIDNQPVGGEASFKQFEQLTTLDVQVPRRSTVARTVFARSTDPFAQINVSVTEISAPGGAPVVGGQQGRIVLNPDPTNPDLENPDLENPDLENPDLENAEVHNPDLENATTRNPDLENPDLENPDLENPDLENTRVANPSIINPDLENPDLENPDLENPDLENPDLENPDLENGALSDTTWTVTNMGNTASAYTVRLALNRVLPEGFRSQLIAHKIYQTPAALGCSLLKQSQTVLLANIPTPRFVAPGELANPDLENPDLENLTVAIAPGETVRITLRVYDPVKADAITFRAAESVTPVAVAQAVNTPEADAGITQPAAAGVLTSSAPVPGGTSGGDYSTTLSSILPGTWTVVGGTVPPGLTVNAATGAITGTPSTPGTYTFTARFQSTTGIIDYRTVTITVGAVGADANVGVTAIGPSDPISIGTPFAFTLNVSNAGPAAATNVRLTDTLPEGTQFVSATTTLGTCQHANGTLLCNLGTLANGSAATIVLNVRPTIGGTHTNTAVVTAAEADPIAANNTAVTTASSAPEVTACPLVCFSGPTNFPAGSGESAFHLERADFNRDGRLDIVFTQAGSTAISVLLGDGAGAFSAPTILTTPALPLSVATVDLNNDGNDDIVVGSSTRPEIWLFFGNGAGGFGASQTVAVGATQFGLQTADLNRDNNADIVLGGSGSLTGTPVVTVLLGNGNGTFQPPAAYGTTNTLANVVVEDFNNDGTPDVAARILDGVSVFLGNGDGTLGAAISTSLPGAMRVRKVGDLNGDGFMDLVVGYQPGAGLNDIIFLPGNGGGGFGTGVPLNGNGLVAYATAANLHGDGDLDLVWVNGRGGFAVQVADGLGGFSTPLYFAGPQLASLLVADVNGDGRLDVIGAVGGSQQSQIIVYLNTCDQPPADLLLTLAGPTAPVSENENFTYTIQISNNGPNDATGVRLEHVLSLASSELVAISGAPGSCSVSQNRLTCDLGTIASGANLSFGVTWRSPAGATFSAIAGVTATTYDPNPADNSAFVQTTVTPGASTLVVTNTNDNGPGSLRWAILAANADGGPADTITFNIDGAGPHTIRPTQLTQLPGITQPVIIDGTTQPGYAGTPVIEISGELVESGTGLSVGGTGSVVRGLAINRFWPVSPGIALVGGGGHTLQGNFIGTNTSGTTILANTYGVHVASSNNVVGGTTPEARNLISGNNGWGIAIFSGTGNTVSGNFIGTNVTGTTALPNGVNGVHVRSAGNTIGGAVTGAGNLIAGNGSDGINLGLGAVNNIVSGNRIGTNAAGTAAIPNTFQGIWVTEGASNNTIGGTTAAARNVISGNNQSGVQISGAGTSANTVVGNFIGTNAAGTAAIANGNGVSVSGAASNNTIGGAAAGARNVISGNAQMGMRLVDAGTTGNRVLGNFIGTNATGSAALANGAYGVDVSNTAGGNTIGGEQTGEGNVISGNSISGVAFRGASTDVGTNTLVGNLIGTDASGTGAIGNALQGVFVMTSNNRIGSLTTSIGNTIAFNGENGVLISSGTGNAIVNNRIFSNINLGIDLAPVGVTANDAEDADVGSNNLQNFPVLSSARTVGSEVRVQVDLTPPPSGGPFRVDFYVNAACDASGAGEGQTPIAVSTFAATTDPTVRFEGVFPTSLVPPGSYLTATTTDAANNTSEFSLCEQVDATAGTANLGITKSDSTDPVTVGQPLTYVMTVSNAGPDAGSAVTVTDTLPAGVTFVSASASIGSCSGTTTVTCALGTVASGSNVTVSIVVTPTTAGLLSNTATVTTTGTDPDAANNSATATTTVNAAGQTIFVVTNTNDASAGSLRQAILDANAQAGPNEIHFAIPGAGVHTIAPLTLPLITEPVTIDGTTQPGFSGTPLIELSGANAGAGANGVVVNGGNSVIRGLIVNRWSSGIVLQGGDSNTVSGNWIGTNSSGAAAAGNINGILIMSSANLVGGSTAGERNVISGNTNGVRVGALSARGNTIAGNYIGTDAAGAADVGNTQTGVLVLGEGNAIGGPGAGDRNVISGNDLFGVQLGEGANANSVQGNLVGTDALGTGAIPNGIGVSVGISADSGASTNTIGGINPGAGNVIAFNTGIGVRVTPSSSDNGIFNNSIFGNGELGIDLNDDGVTPNDPEDEDSNGGNGLQNYPVLTMGANGVTGTLNSTPNSAFLIQYFSSAACDASGFGEGAVHFAQAAVNTDASGNATLPLIAVPAGQAVAATATGPSNNTSEFSACVVPLGATAEIAVSVVDSPDPVVVGGQLSYTVTVTNNGPSPATNVRLTSVWNGPFNVDATGPAATCEFTPVFTCSFGTLASGANATLGIVGTPGAIGLLGGTFTVQADEDDPQPGNNAVAVNTSVVGAPSSFLVTNTSDSGLGSLRQAIIDANANPAADSINFAIPGAGVHTITLASSLPIITDAVTIDGLTQPGFAGSPLIELNGNGLTASGLRVSAPNTTIRGLVINRFVGGGSGILISGVSAVNTVVQGNYIGTNAAGTAALPNSAGITIMDSASGTLIGGTAAGMGNVISGNTSHGISVSPGALASVIQGNFIGLNQSGSAALPNGGYGIQISSSGTTIGGTGAGARNIIGGNGLDGVALSGAGATSNIVLGNYIGTNIDGTGPVPNSQGGIVIGSQAHDNTIGGAAAGAGNVISGNGGRGITIWDPGATGNIVQGNLIGTNAAGTASVPNAIFGIFIFDTSNNQIGGTAAGAGNLISGNGDSGIALSGAGTVGNVIQGNRIGTNAAGTSGVPNAAHGISISGASNNQVGGAAGNIIRFNSRAGVSISTALSTIANLVSGNSISDNVELGIDLGPTGVTPNDTGDADTGANDLQNFPVLTAASGGVEGTLNSSPNTTYRIEFFGNVACDASGNGEGATFLGATDVTTDGTGNATIPLFTAAAGQFVTATATDPSNNTSEFSACVLTAEPAGITLTATDADAAELGGNTGTVVVSRTGPTTADRDVEVTISGTATNDGTDYVISSPSLVGPVVGSVFTVRIPAGQTAATITITPIFGAAVEGPETVVLTGEGSSATVTIADEPAVTLAATDPDAAEAGPNTGTIVATRMGPTTYDRDVEVTISGTASNDGSDFTISSPSLVGPAVGSVFLLRIPTGQTTATVTVTPIVSPQVEGPETVVFSAEGSAATVTIVDQFPPLALTVTNTNDSGAGSLRAAILAANANAGVADTISFDIPGPGPHSIALTSVLPLINDPLIIDGTTEPDFAGSPVIELVGTSAGADTAGLTLAGSGSVVRGLVINGFSGPGIHVSGSAVITGNYIGTDVTGTLARPNASGISLDGASSDSTIGGTTSASRNVISGNTGGGILILASARNTIQGNYIGLTPSGATALGNGPFGISLSSSLLNLIGGTAPGAGNVVAASSSINISVQSASNFNTIQGNRIGTNAAGTAVVGANQNGIYLISSDGNQIGGTVAGARNLIAGSSGSGQIVLATGSTENQIQGNYIGTDVSGTIALGGGTWGIQVAAPGNMIGGGAAGAGNLISGNGGGGIVLFAAASGNTVEGNLIGTGADGITALPNQTYGIGIQGGSSNTIGGATAPNIIAFNAGPGIAVGSGAQNRMRGNSIFSNAGLGIDLGPTGVTPNDTGDADVGANNLQNFPALTAASGGVEGTLDSLPNATFGIEFFGNTACDASGNGEGQTFLGAVNVTTDGTGNATIPLFTATAGQFVTATATDLLNNTSEFSVCVESGPSLLRTWISDASGFWEDPDNWSDGIVPRNGDQVVINRPGANPIVTIQTAVVTLASLTSEEPLVNNGGSLTFDGPAVLNGGLTMSGGSFSGAGDLTLGGLSLWTGGNITGTGAMTVSTSASLSVNTPGAAGVLGRTINNLGTLAWNQASLSLNGASIFNLVGGVFDVQGNFPIGGGTILNAGTLLKSGPAGPLTLSNVAFTTTGTLQLRLGTTSDSIVSDGTATLGGTLDVRTFPGFTPTSGQLFDLLSFAGGRIGTFAAVNGNGQTYTPSYTATGVTLIVGDGGTADVELTKIDTPDPATIGQALAYSLTVVNNGPGTAASVTVADTLPPGMAFLSATPSQGSCTIALPTITCGLGVLTNAASASVTIVVVPNALGAISNTASVTTTSDDPVSANNTATAITNVVNPNLTFTVTNTNDSGAGSLRQAILDANGNVSAQDSILFQIPGTGPFTIRPASPLPTISDPVSISGTSQPGYVDRPIIELDGTNAGSVANGLFITAGNSWIRGLSITRFGTGGALGAAGGAGIVVMQGPGGNVFESNYLGLDPLGAAQPNRSDGIFVEGSPNNYVGGLAGAGNVISGNGRNGITLNGTATTATLVFGNFIGTADAGISDRGNGADGVAIFDAPSNYIGISEGNVISGNGGAGVTISGSNAQFNFVSGNVIGADVGATEPIPNDGHGVVIVSGANNNSIGILGALGPNVIAFNAGAGVQVVSGLNNSIRQNSIFGNGQLGIDLGAAGVTANDAGDGDSGANHLQNFPVLTLSPGGVTGTLNTVPNSLVLVDVFSTPTCDASGHGEGTTWIGTDTLFVDAVGNATMSLFTAPAGQFITATATDAANNTSEFSACVQVQSGITLSLPNTLPIGVGRSVTATVALSEPAPAGGVIVTVTSDAPGTASITAPGTVSIPEGGTAGQVTVNGVDIGTTTLRASAPGYAQGTLSVGVTQNLISTPATLNVAFGQSTALPVNIGPSPAPPGGLTLDVVSINPSIVEVVTPQITVPEGALSANATVRGASFGNATVTVSNPLYSPSETAVSSSGALNIIQSAASMHVGLPSPTLTVQLESNGTPVAPLTDLVVELTSANAQCVTVPASATIPAGLVSTTFTASHGGTATLPCTAVVTATSSSLTADTVAVTVNSQAGITMPGAATVGAGLQGETYAFLGASEHGGVLVTVQSSDPTRVLVSRDASTAGTASFTVNIPNGQTYVPYHVQGLENVTGSADVTVSAPGFATGSHTVDVVPSGVEIVNLQAATTTLSADDAGWYLQVGIPCAGNTQVCLIQSVRAGGPAFIVTLTLTPAQTPIAQLKSDQPVATGQSVTKPIAPGIYYSQAVAPGTSYGLALDPLGTGTTTVTATGPLGVLTLSSGVRSVTISGPGITMPGAATVGAGLQGETSAYLGASEHGGVLVTVQSSDPTRVLVSRDASTAGTASFTVNIPNGQTYVPYHVQGLENVTGSADVTVSAPGFATGSHTVDVVPSGVEIVNLQAATTTLSADDAGWYLQVGIPCAGNTQVCLIQSVRAGGPAFIVTLTLTPAQTPIAQLKSDQPVATGQSVTKPIAPGIYYSQAVAPGTSYGLALDPLGTGTTTVTATGPLGVLTLSSGVRSVTISGPGITMPGAATVGAGLQSFTSAFLGASEHGGVLVTVQSSDPTRVLVSPDAATAGTASFTVNLANSQTYVPYHVQGVENVTGSANVTVSAPGFATGSHTVDVVPSGVEIGNLNANQTNLSAPDVGWYVQVGIPCAGNTQVCAIQPVRAGGPAFIVTLANTEANVARLSSDQPATTGQVVTKPIQPGTYYTQAVAAGTSYGLGFDPLSNGQTSVSVTGPIGTLTMSVTGVRNVTVSSPAINPTVSTVTVGSGLQVAASAYLGASQHGGVTVTVTSSAPAVVLVSPDSAVAGEADFEIFIDNNATFVPLVVQGVEGATGTAIVTLSAPGFTSATITVTVTPSAIEIQGLPTSISAGSANAVGWYVQVGIPCTGNVQLCLVQSVRAGSPGFVVTLANSTAAVAQLGSDEPVAVGQTVTKPIQPGYYYTLAVPAGTQYGLVFDPIAPGTTTVTATGPFNVITTSQAIRTVVISP